MQITLPPFSALLRGRSPLWGITLICALLLWMGGCQKVERTNDPKLKPLQEMLDAQLPAGTPESKVLTFLDNRGYPVLPSGEPGTIVTSIRHINQQRLLPPSRSSWRNPTRSNSAAPEYVFSRAP